MFLHRAPARHPVVAERCEWRDGAVSSGVTSRRQPWQYREGAGAQTAKGAQSNPNYVSRLLLDCVPVFHKIITTAYSYFTVPDRSLFIIPKSIPYSVVPVREDRVRGGRARLRYSSMGPEFLVMPLHVVCVCARTASKTVEPIDVPFRVWTRWWEKGTMY